jgi:hypothetical protein
MFKTSLDKNFKPSDAVSVGDNVCIFIAVSNPPHLDCFSNSGTVGVRQGYICRFFLWEDEP